MANQDLKPVEAQEDDKGLSVFLQWFEDSEERTQTARGLSERDRDYYDTNQLTTAEISILNERGQPVVQFNRIRGNIDYLLGAEIQGRTDPRAHPRTPKDEDASYAITDALRYIVDKESFDITRTESQKNMLIEGIGVCEVIVAAKFNKEPVIRINHIPWDRFFYDPHSRDVFFRDARYMGIVIWSDFDQAVLLADNPEKAAEAIEEEFARSRTGQSETYDDKPLGNSWVDSKRRRVRVVQMNYWSKEGWKKAMFTGAGFLREPRLSPYLDEDEVPENDIYAVSGYVDRNNQRSGVVRPMIDPQDEINKRRSKGIHSINTKQIVVEKGAVQDPRKTRREYAKPDGYIEVNPGALDKIRVEENTDMSVGNLNMLAEAKAEIDVMAPNAALQGQGPASQSGRSLLLQQQGGLVSLGPIFDQRRHWDFMVYGGIYNRVKQFKTSEWWIRVTDDDNAPRFVGLNIPQTNLDLWITQMMDDGLPEEEIQEAAQKLSQHPAANQPAPPQNPVAETDIDIKIEDAPDITTIQQEQFRDIVELAKSGMVDFTAEEIIQLAPGIRNKRQMLDARKRRQEAQAKELKQAKQIAIASQEMEALKDRSVVAKNESAAVKGFAETAKIKAETVEIQSGASNDAG